jgi:hypothetical protein
MKKYLYKKIILAFLTVFFFIPVPNISNSAGVKSEQQKPIPPYAKWGRLAMIETKARYPHTDIIDYLHIGRVTTPGVTTENFKLWLRDTASHKEFGVLITIKFDTNTERLNSITFQETSH